MISGNGALVAFRSLASNLVAEPEGGAGQRDVFLYERATGTVTLVSRIPGSPISSGVSSDNPVTAEAGTLVVFSSPNNLVPADFNLTTDVFAVPVTGAAPTDTTAPDTTITASPANPTSAANATVAFTGSDDVTPPASLTFECRLDGGAFAACASPASYAGPLADGPHTLEVRARDAAGNVDPTPAGATWTIDTVPPDTAITGGPSGLTNSGSASFTFTSTEPAGGFECQLDGGAWTGCTSGQSYAGLTDGPRSFAVRAHDAAGNVDLTPATRNWTVDVTLPTIAITTPANGARYLLDQAVSAGYGCTDASGVALCAGPVTSGTRIDTATVGAKSFRVDATDGAGNTQAVTHTYTVVYDFAGFVQPVDNLPVYNQVNAGRAIPVKFSLGGSHGLNIFASGYPASAPVFCDSSALVDAVEETVTAGSSSLQYDAAANQYVYVWKTSATWANTCRQLVIGLRDGSYYRANFRFR